MKNDHNRERKITPMSAYQRYLVWHTLVKGKREKRRVLNLRYKGKYNEKILS